MKMVARLITLAGSEDGEFAAGQHTAENASVTRANLIRIKRAIVVAALTGAIFSCSGGLHRGRWLNPSPVYARQMDSAYTDRATCSLCHGDIAASYGQTGMGQSFHRVTSAGRIGDFQVHNTLYNRASDRHYRMIEKAGAFFEQRFQIGFDGKETNREEMRIDYVVGSGSHAYTFLHRTREGKLIELPVSWYSEAGGYWEMSPGYDGPHQQGFRRAISYECMACHNGYPAPDPAMNGSPDKDIFGENLPEGVDCQRCHGPGAAHVRAVEEGASTEAIQAAIVNPARLSRDRQMDACMQCHLETTSWPLPHSLRRFEHNAFDYRPGTPLEDYELAFDRKPGTGYEDDFEVAHQAYQLRKSACFRKSQMTCITCHDPHRQLHGEEATRHYVSICLGCHTGVHAAGIPGQGAQAKRTGAEAPTCLTCHMWKQRTDDAVHVVMTDHYIQRFKPKGDPLAPAKHNPGYYRGEVVPYYPDSLSGIPNGDLYLAIAQTEDDANLQAGTMNLRNAINRDQPAAAEFYFAMGAAYSKLGRNAESIRWYEEALSRRPDYGQARRAEAAALEAAGDLPHAAEAGEKAVSTGHPDTVALTNLGRVYLGQGRLDDAKRVLGQALTIDPELPNANLLLGMTLMREGDAAGAESLYRSAIDSEPDLAEAHNNLAGILARRGNYAEAAYEFEKSEEADPGNVQVHANYAALLSHIGSTDKAITELKAALRLDPKSAQLHLRLGDLFGQISEGSEAEQEYRAAVAQSPQSGPSNLRLADLLVREGKGGEARGYYETAAKSTDPGIRAAALKALRK